MGRTASPWYRKSEDAWYSTIGGRQRLLAKGKKNRPEAVKAFHELKAKEKEDEAARVALPLKVIANNFLVATEQTHEEVTRKDYGVVVKSFVRAVGIDEPSRDVKPYQVTEWLDSKKWGRGTRAKAGAIIKRMFSFAVEQGHLEVNPIAQFKTGSGQRRALVMTNAQADAVYAAATGDRFRSLLTALRETGCRPKEIYTLTADRISLDAGTWLVINKTRKKTGEELRTIYLSPRMVDLSRELVTIHPEGAVFRNRFGHAWGKASVSARFRTIQKKLAYGPECVPYAYRHLYITDALERGVPPATLAELVGHTDLTMIMKVYSRLKDRTQHLREAAIAARGSISADRSPSTPWCEPDVASAG